MKTKICTVCKIEYPATLEYFNKSKAGKYGIAAKCKACMKEYRSELRIKSKEQTTEYNKKYYKEHLEYFKKHNELYPMEHKEELKIKRKEKYLKNIDKHKQYRTENKEHYKIWRSQYYINNKEKFSLLTQKRLAKKRKLSNTLTINQWEQIKKVFDYKCAYCGMTEEEHLKRYDEHLNQEHFIPLSKGGEYTHNNIIPACKSCNSSKNNKNFFEWYSQQFFYSKERECFILNFLNYTADGKQQLMILII